MVSLWPLTLICIFAFSISVTHSKTLKRGVKALNEIKASLGWTVVYAQIGDDPCGNGDLPPWSGVTCLTQGDYRAVTELEVYAVSIVCPFPIAVTNLLDLTRFLAKEGGSLELANYEEQRRLLDLHNNKLTGPIPPQTGWLRQLRMLWNKLQGVLPPEIDELKRFRHLDVGNNHLVGIIREFIRIEGCFPVLQNLYLNKNYLTGGVLAQLANLTNLEILYLSYNKISVVIPSAFAYILKLTYLYLDHNQFSGRILSAFYKHPLLKELYIEGNGFQPRVNPTGAHKVLGLSDTDFLV